MLEPIVRSSLPRLQTLYDRAPSPARNLLTSARGWLLTQIRYSSKTFAILEELQRNEQWPSEQIAAYQLCALRQTIVHACRTVPFCGDSYRVEIHSMSDLCKLPILDRETVLQNQERLISRAVPSHRRIRASTTGTTGANLRVAYTEDLVRRNWAFLLRQWAWADIEPRAPRITLQGARIVPTDRAGPPYWARNVPERQTLMSIFHLSEATAPAYLDFLGEHSGEVLEGFPSVLGILANFALERGGRAPMRAVFTSGEPLYPSIRRKIEEAFAARVFDTYGMTEYCGLIQECERGGMHLAPEYGFLEILDANGDLVAPGEEGDFVWTGFINDAMPLVRYRIGDRGMWDASGSCSCGRAFPLVVPTITRESDILRCPDGRLFSPRALNQFLKQSRSLRFCQFVHEAQGRLVVRAVPRGVQESSRIAEEVNQICADLRALLDPCMEVTAEFAAIPISGRGGKTPLIVNRVMQ